MLEIMLLPSSLHPEDGGSMPSETLLS